MQVIWSKNAEITFDVMTEYIQSKFGKKSVLKFISKVNSVILTIQYQPYIYKFYSDFNSIRKATIAKQSSMFYEIVNDKITILYF